MALLVLSLSLAVCCVWLGIDTLDQRKARYRAERECERYRRRASEFFVSGRLP